MALKSLFGIPSLIAGSAARPKSFKVERRVSQVVDPNPAKFHCVEVKAVDCTCEAIKQLAGLRFLSDEAPLLPLPECSAGTCRCRYEHHEDRRQDLRRNPYGVQRAVPPPHIDEDRRAGKDRRGKRS
jgi:hypothetical protein